MAMAMAMVSSVVDLSPSFSPSSSSSSSASSINSDDTPLPFPPPPSPPSSLEHAAGVNPRRPYPTFLPSSASEGRGAACGRFQPSPTKLSLLPDSCVAEKGRGLTGRNNDCGFIGRKNNCRRLWWKKEPPPPPKPSSGHPEAEREMEGSRCENCGRLWSQEALPRPRHRNIAMVLPLPDSCAEDGWNCGCLRKEEPRPECEMEDGGWNCRLLQQPVQKSCGNTVGTLPVMDSCAENGRDCGCLQRTKELSPKTVEHPDFEMEDRENCSQLWPQEASPKPRGNTAGTLPVTDSCAENGRDCGCLQRKKELWLKTVKHPEFKMEDRENCSRLWPQEASPKPCGNTVGTLLAMDSCAENGQDFGYLQQKKELWPKTVEHLDFEMKDRENCSQLWPQEALSKPRGNIAGILSSAPDSCAENGRDCSCLQRKQELRPKTVEHPDFEMEDRENCSRLWPQEALPKACGNIAGILSSALDSCAENGRDCGCLQRKKELWPKTVEHPDFEMEDRENCSRLWPPEASPKPRRNIAGILLSTPDSCAENGRDCGYLQQKKELWPTIVEHPDLEMEDRENCSRLWPQEASPKPCRNIAGLLPVSESCTENGWNCDCLQRRKELWLKTVEHPDFEMEDRENCSRLWPQEASLKSRRNIAGLLPAPDSCTESGCNCDCLQQRKELWPKPVRHRDFEMEYGENCSRLWLQEASPKPSRHAGRSVLEYEYENGSNYHCLQRSLPKSCRNIAGVLLPPGSCTEENGWNCSRLQWKKELWPKPDGHPDFEMEDRENCSRCARRLLLDSEIEYGSEYRRLQQREPFSPIPRCRKIAGMLPPPDSCTENGRNCSHFRSVGHPGRSLLDFTAENGENYGQLWPEKPSPNPSRHAGRPLADSDIEDGSNYRQSQKMDSCTANKWNCGHLRPARRHPARSPSYFAMENGLNDSELWPQQGHPLPLKPARQTGRRRSSLPDSKTEEDRTNRTLLIQRRNETDSIPLRLPPYLQQQVNCLPSPSSSSTSPLSSKKPSHLYTRSKSTGNTSSSLSLFLPGHGEQKKKKLDRREKAKDDPFLAAMELCTKEEEEEEEDTEGKEESSMSFYNMPSKMMNKLLRRKASLPYLCSSAGSSQIQPSRTVVKVESSSLRLRQRGRLQWTRIKSAGDELWQDLELGLKLQGVAKKLKEAKSIALSQAKPISAKCEQLFAKKREIPSSTTTQKKSSSCQGYRINGNKLEDPSSCQGTTTMDHTRKLPSKISWKGKKKVHEV